MLRAATATASAAVGASVLHMSEDSVLSGRRRSHLVSCRIAEGGSSGINDLNKAIPQRGCEGGVGLA